MNIKTAFIFILFLLVAPITWAQPFFGKVVDKDGYVNLRKDHSMNAEIHRKIPDGALIYIYDLAENNFAYITYEENQKYYTGYIHNSRIKRINQYKRIPFTKKNGELLAKTDPFSVSITFKNFGPKQEKKFFSGEHHESYKGKESMGIDCLDFTGARNSKKFHSISVTYNGKKMSVPTTDLEHLFSVTEDPNYISCYFNSQTNSLYIETLNGDGACAYTSLFVFENKSYTKAFHEIPF